MKLRIKWIDNDMQEFDVSLEEGIKAIETINSAIYNARHSAVILYGDRKAVVDITFLRIAYMRDDNAQS